MSDKSAIFHELKPSVGEITKHCNILLNHCKDVEEEGALVDHEIFQNFSFQLEKTKDHLIDAITGRHYLACEFAIGELSVAFRIAFNVANRVCNSNRANTFQSSKLFLQPVTHAISELKNRCAEFLKIIAKYPADLLEILTEEEIAEREKVKEKLARERAQKETELNNKLEKVRADKLKILAAREKLEVHMTDLKNKKSELVILKDNFLKNNELYTLLKENEEKETEIKTMESSIVDRSKALRSAIQQVDEREVALFAQEKDLEKSLNTILGSFITSNSNSHKKAAEAKKVSPTPDSNLNQITKEDLILDDEKDSKPKAENKRPRSKKERKARRKERRKKEIEKDKNRNDWNDPIVYRPPIVRKKSANLLNISSSSSSSSMPSYETESKSSSSSSRDTNTTQPTTTVTATSIKPQTKGDAKDESSSLSSSRSRSRSRSSSSSYSSSSSPRPVDNTPNDTPSDHSRSISEKTIHHSLSNDALNSFLINNPDIVNQVDRIVQEEKANSKQLTKLNDLDELESLINAQIEVTNSQIRSNPTQYEQQKQLLLSQEQDVIDLLGSSRGSIEPFKPIADRNAYSNREKSVNQTASDEPSDPGEKLTPVKSVDGNKKDLLNVPRKDSKARPSSNRGSSRKQPPPISLTHSINQLKDDRDSNGAHKEEATPSKPPISLTFTIQQLREQEGPESPRYIAAIKSLENEKAINMKNSNKNINISESNDINVSNDVNDNSPQTAKRKPASKRSSDSKSKSKSSSKSHRNHRDKEHRHKRSSRDSKDSKDSRNNSGSLKNSVSYQDSRDINKLKNSNNNLDEIDKLLSTIDFSTNGPTRSNNNSDAKDLASNPHKKVFCHPLFSTPRQSEFDIILNGDVDTQPQDKTNEHSHKSVHQNFENWIDLLDDLDKELNEGSNRKLNGNIPTTKPVIKRRILEEDSDELEQMLSELCDGTF